MAIHQEYMMACSLTGQMLRHSRLHKWKTRTNPLSK